MLEAFLRFDDKQQTTIENYNAHRMIKEGSASGNFIAFNLIVFCKLLLRLKRGVNDLLPD